MSDIAVTDSAGNPLHVGSFVVYSGTGTKGTITEIMSDNEGIWALIDKTNLYYKTDTLRTINLVQEKELEEKEFSREEVSEKLEKQKEFVPTEMDHSNVESGG